MGGYRRIECERVQIWAGRIGMRDVAVGLKSNGAGLKTRLYMGCLHGVSMKSELFEDLKKYEAALRKRTNETGRHRCWGFRWRIWRRGGRC